MGILTMWIMYAFFGITIFSLLFVWAVRQRQFTEQNRARYLVLHGMEEGAANGERVSGNGEPLRQQATEATENKVDSPDCRSPIADPRRHNDAGL